MVLTRSDIERLVPHAGAMCLLDEVVQWDADCIVCHARAVCAGHPLLRAGRVPSVVAPEYGAQAAAVHGCLLDPAGHPRAGLLATLAQVDLQRADFPFDQPVAVRARRLGALLHGCRYSFAVSVGSQVIAQGCLVVALEQVRNVPLTGPVTPAQVHRA